MKCWCLSVVVIMLKKCLAEVETLVQSPASRMDTRGRPDAKAADTTVPQTVLRDICALAIGKTSLTQNKSCWHTLAYVAYYYHETDRT